MFWGKRVEPARLAVSARRHQARRDPEQAMFRELEEEIGLQREPRAHPRPHARLAALRGARAVDAPRDDARGHYRGQKQIWYLLRMMGRDCDVNLRASDHPEFDAWRWHDYWVPLDAVIEFKREVYRQALIELHRYLQADRRARVRRPEVVPPGLRSMEREYDPLPIRELGAGAGFRRPTQAEAARVTAGFAGAAGDDRSRARESRDHPAAGAARRREPVHDHPRGAPAARGGRARRHPGPHYRHRPSRRASDAGRRRTRPAPRRAQRGRRHDASGADRGDRVRRRARPPASDMCSRRCGASAGSMPWSRTARTPVCGIFSISQIARQLGLTLASGGSVARTFSEIEAALSR